MDMYKCKYQEGEDFDHHTTANQANLYGSVFSVASTSDWTDTSSIFVSEGSSLHDHSIDSDSLAPSMRFDQSSIAQEKPIMPVPSCSHETLPSEKSSSIETKYDESKYEEKPIMPVPSCSHETLPSEKSSSIETKYDESNSPAYSSHSTYEKNCRQLSMPVMEESYKVSEKLVGYNFSTTETSQMEFLLRPSIIPELPRTTFGLSKEERSNIKAKCAEDRVAHMEWTQDGYRFRKYIGGVKIDDEEVREKVEKNMHRMEYEHHCEKNAAQKKSKLYKLKSKFESFCKDLRRKQNGDICPGDISLKIKNGPSMLQNEDWTLTDSDFLSIKDEKKQFSEKATFRLLHKKVGNHNWSSKKKVVLMHPRFFPDFQKWTNGNKEKPFNHSDYMSFRDPRPTTVLIPFFEADGQFVLLAMSRSKGRVITAQIDSSFTKKKLEPKKFEELAEGLFLDSRRKKKIFHFCQSTQIQKQSSVMDSAALGIRNVEIFLETPIFFKNFEKFRPKRLDNPQDGIATIVSNIRGRLARDLEEFSLEMEDAPRNGHISNLVSEQSSQVSSLNQPANCDRRYLKKSTKFSVKLDSIDEAEEEAVEIITRPQLLGGKGNTENSKEKDSATSEFIQINNTIKEWAQNGPEPGEVSITMGGVGISHHFLIDQNDVTETRQYGSMISSSAVWHLLFKMISKHNVGRSEEDQFRLIHPDFWSNNRNSNNMENLRNYEAFSQCSNANRVIVPILLTSLEHFILVVIGTDSENRIRVHILDSLHGSPDVFSDDAAKTLAKTIFNSTSEIIIERGTESEVERQSFDGNDCGIFTIMNGLRYIENEQRRLLPIQEMIPRNTNQVTNTTELRRRLANDLAEILYLSEALKDDNLSNTSHKLNLTQLKEQKKEKNLQRTNTARDIALDIRREPRKSKVAQTPENVNVMTPKTPRNWKFVKKSSSTTSSKKTPSVESIEKAREAKKFSRARDWFFNPSITNTIEGLINNIETIKAFGENELQALRKRVYNQLNYKVDGPKGMTVEERKKRQLFRMPFHTFEDDGKEYIAITVLWDKLRREFAIGSPEKNIRNPEPVNEEIIEDELFEQEMESVSSKDTMNDSTEDIESDLINDQFSQVDLMTTPKRTKPEAILDEFKEALAEEHGEDVGRLIAGDPIATALVEQCTRARRCDDECLTVERGEAAAIHEILLANVTPEKVTVENQKDGTLAKLQYEWNDETRSVEKWIEAHKRCSQGLRSLSKRYAEIDQLRKLIIDCAEVLKRKNMEEMKEFLNNVKLTNCQQLKFDDEYMMTRDQSHHKQSNVDRKNLINNEAFKSEMEKSLATEVCTVCSQYTPKKGIFNEHVFKWKHLLPSKISSVLNDNQKIKVCIMCKKDGSNALRMPPAALLNGFEVDECPQELSCLNAVESILIEKARANMKTCYLKNVGGKKTGMKSTNAVLVVLPTEIEATLHHVAKTLPSADFLKIQVRTGWGKEYLVSMIKVIRALKWLKANNPIYHDIEIDENFHFVLNDNIFFQKKDATQQDADDLISRHLLTQVVEDVEEQPIQHISEKTNEQLVYKKYNLKKNPYIPISLDSKFLDLKIFPKLHPLGRNGSDADRKVPVALPKYLRTRLRASCRYWARSASWLCYCFGRKQQLMLSSVQGVQARVKSGTRGWDFDLNDPKTQKSLFTAFSKSRGFPQYWKTIKYSLRSHVAHYGPPTWFITLNPNTKGWKDLHQLYSIIMDEEINEKNIDAAIAKDPEIFSRYWRSRVEQFWKEVIMAKKNAPLGVVTHYFRRVEYQHRGTQHLHAVLWTRNRPTRHSTNAEIADFIEQHVTARMPDEKEEKDLYDLIVNQQMHWATHSKTCRRVVKFRNRHFTTKCRFGFPRPVIRRTVFFGDAKKCRIPGITNRPYLLARTKLETMINDYCPAISRMWNSNTDVQYIPYSCRDVVNYICAYTTKGEKAKKREKSDLSRYSLDGLNQTKALYKVGIDMLEQREVGLLELVDDLMGHPNFAFDQAHVFIPVDAKNDRLRLLRPKAQLKENEIVYQTSWLDHYYENRCDEFEEMSLYNLMTNFEVVTVGHNQGSSRRKRPLTKEETSKGNVAKVKRMKKGDSQSEEENGESDEIPIVCNEDAMYNRGCILSPFFNHPGIENGEKRKIVSHPYKCMRKVKQKVGRFFLKKIVEEDLESHEDFYRRLCLLFVPWRQEDEILKANEAKSYFDVWKQHKNNLKNQSAEAYKDLKTLISGYTRLEEEEAELEKRMDRIRAAKEALNLDEEAEEEVKIQIRQVNAENHQENLKKLNSVQNQVITEVLNVINAQEEVRAKNKEIQIENETRMKQGKPRQPLLKKPDPLNIMLAGVAGTGKSFVINTLADALTLRYSKSENDTTVLLAAPTGIAALAIDGNTIHSLLAIEVVQANHYAEELFNELDRSRLDELRFLFAHVRLLIIDEVSMVSNMMLLKIHHRLREISGKHEPFGGYNIMVCGDLLQLPPVKAAQPFKQLSSAETFRVFGTISMNVNLWHVFKYYELTENMRQGEDLKLAEAFGRIRCGEQTKEDISMLKERRIEAENISEPSIEEIGVYFEAIRAEDPRVMALFATNAEVNEFNATILRMIADDCITIDAQDDIDLETMRRLQNVGMGQSATRSRPWQSWTIREAENETDLKRIREMENSEEITNRSFIDNIIHGGLPSQLTVALNSRVMLRRNIDISARLVNGATGSILQFKYDSNQNVQSIVVEFDGGIITEIEKVRARFLRKKNVMCRLMFPLVLSYGATIHKSQGLTLGNVVIRSRNIFSPGQFYVALSRVTKLSGLHLAGFHSDKIKVDLTALSENNRLRQSIGLPPIGNCRARKSEQNSLEIDSTFKSSKTSTAKGRKQRETHELRKSAKDIELCVPAIRPVDHMNKYGICQNVIIAVIHILCIMEKVFESIRKAMPLSFLNGADSLSFLGIHGCINKKQKDVIEIVENCSKYVNNISSTKDIVEHIFENALPSDISALFTRETKIEEKCLNCKNSTIFYKNRRIVWLSQPNAEQDDEKKDIVKALSKKFHSYTQLAEQCNYRNPDQTICSGKKAERSSVGYGEFESPYLVVGNEDGTNWSYKAKGNDPIEIDSSRFLLIGGISIGRTAKDEVEAWYKCPDSGWIYSNSTTGSVEYCTNVALDKIDFSVWIEKKKTRLMEKDKEKLLEKDQVLDDFQIIRDESDIEDSFNQALPKQKETAIPKKSSTTTTESTTSTKKTLITTNEISKNNTTITTTVTKTTTTTTTTTTTVSTSITPIAPSERLLKSVNPTPMRNVLLLKNRENDCFLNVCVSLLYSIGQFRLSVIQNMTKLTGELNSLAELFHQKVDNVGTLRNQLNVRYQSGMHDLNEVFIHLLEKFEDCGHPELFNSFACEVQKGYFCSNGCQFPFTTERELTTMTMMTREKENLNRMIEASAFIPQSRCTTCNKGQLSMTRVVQKTGDYHVVTMEKTATQLIESLKGNDEIEMFGDSWILMSFGEWMQPIHYRTWIKTLNHWICISDDKITKKVELKKMDLRDYHARVLVFLKMSRRKEEAEISEKVANRKRAHQSTDPVEEDDSPNIKKFKTDMRLKIDDIFSKMKTAKVGAKAEAVKCLALKNRDGSSCFLNAALNMIFACKPLRQVVINLAKHHSNAIKMKDKQLVLTAEIFKGEKTVERLRKAMPQFETGQKDSGSALEYLLPNILQKPESRTAIEFHCTRVVKCPNCAHEQIKPARKYLFSRVTASEGSTFEDCWEKKMEERAKCQKCRSEATSYKKFEKSGEYLMVLVDQNSSEADAKFLKFDRTNIFNLGGNYWSVVAYTQYVRFKDGGHYISWLKSEASENWVRVNDDIVGNSRRMPDEIILKSIVLKRF